MIIVTGAAGFIGSCLINRLNAEGFNDIVAVDDFSNAEKNKNLAGKQIRESVDRNVFFTWLDKHAASVTFIFHIGARTDTAEFNREIFEELNVSYSKLIWQKCSAYQIALVYASSAATYGLGELGYDDDETLIPQLKPLNPYGESKQAFDKWALQQPEKPLFWAGLKFFNVYGSNEYHKDRMASVIFHAFRQIQQTGRMKLFRSHHPDYHDGEQKRDFVYVKDVVAVCLFLMRHRQYCGIYNLGSGTARTFLDLAHHTFRALGREPNIEFIDTPADIRDNYQYFTEARMDKLRGIGYAQPFHSLEAGIADYVQGYLTDGKYF